MLEQLLPLASRTNTYRNGGGGSSLGAPEVLSPSLLRALSLRTEREKERNEYRQPRTHGVLRRTEGEGGEGDDDHRHQQHQFERVRRSLREEEGGAWGVCV